VVSLFAYILQHMYMRLEDHGLIHSNQRGSLERNGGRVVDSLHEAAMDSSRMNTTNRTVREMEKREPARDRIAGQSHNPGTDHVHVYDAQLLPISAIYSPGRCAAPGTPLSFACRPQYLQDFARALPPSELVTANALACRQHIVPTHPCCPSSGPETNCPAPSLARPGLVLCFGCEL
jgi:hypothetical protein